MTESIRYEDIAAFPKPGGRIPTQFQFSEDGRRVYYLYPENGDELSLWVFDSETGDSRLVAEAPREKAQDTFEEEMRRQRARFAWSGIGRYQWSGGRLLIPWHGKLYSMTGESGSLTLVPNGEGLLDPRLTHNGRWIVGVLDGNLVKVNPETGHTERITSEGGTGLTYGLAEYAAQEELDRSRGYWISEDDRYIAFTEVEEQHIPVYPIVHQAADPVWVEEHRYPFVGQDNAKVRLGVRPLDGDGPIQWLNWGEGERYLVDVLWSPGGELLVLTIARDHQHLAWDRYDAEGNRLGRAYEETSERWINRPGLSVALADGGLVTTSEREGLRRVLVISADGHFKTLENPSDEAVINILACNAETKTVYVSLTRRRALERTLAQVNWESGYWEELTPEPGWYAAAADSQGRAFVTIHSDFDSAPETQWLSEGKQAVIRDNPVSRTSLELAEPTLFEVKASDGTILNGLAYVPEGTPPTGGWPLVVSVYGGPHAQMVVHEWSETVDLQAQYLQQHGYLVIKVDSRGSFNRGPDFESVLFRRFGETELEDQIAGVEEAARRWPVNRERMGIYGWSYGGYMTLRALLMAPEVFKVGVSGAPVTDFRWYDTAYTERYLGTDENNHEGYESTSLLNKADRLQGKLLLIHGMVDENVHFRHSAAMIQAFIDAGKDFDLIVLPNSRHMVQGASNSLYRVRRTLEYFLKNL
ncbi:S9 family peptidase [Sulfobacillus harzensis]|uniref:S9 family peptidase n=1 Tax=Sulfobacillus harzensis TaxID=2729629 RepID=A0A7Y0L603_9FIRM|nr:prolyl oligopeptidase family serine peptidase [Sulfobacillus harzensis]NMP23587.1 S9 family peptidase [Sulfobacillus harzensis]